ncbi:MAG TPA: nuclear transport factor 2 family protein, partial [Burkholderiales bacterium]|nr:nuclear transport factor 2 family protein [Burkholderiales bacterium]
MGGIALAGPQEDVAAAATKWAAALAENDPDKMLPLYAQDAVLWGTLSPTVRSNPASLRDYFVNAFKALPGLKVAFGEQLIRIYGSTAINTG